jgi:DNA replication protein DnaC
MTQAKIKQASCSRCGDRHYVLNNKDGALHAEVCPCFECDRCDGNGRVFRESERGQSYLAECECAVFRKRVGMLTDSGIPGKYVDAEFDNYQTARPFHPSQKKAKSRAKDFLKEMKNGGKGGCRGLAFIGGPGLGKTHLVIALIKSLILEEGIDCKFVDFFQLLSDIRHAYSEDRSDQDLIRPYIRSRVLVIDELAKGRNNEWETTILDQFISSRYNAADKLTLFTSNFSSEPSRNGKMKSREDRFQDTAAKTFSENHTHQTLKDKIGDRIHSRLAEMCDFISMEGPDYRVINAKPPARK